MRGQDKNREPCPDRIPEDIGMAFSMGLCGSFLWQFFKGYRNSPVGEKMSGAFFNARGRAPITGGNFASWGACFAAFDCTFIALRQKEDMLNAVAAGTATGFVLALRGGLKAAATSGVIGGVFLAVIEGAMMLMQNKTAMTPRKEQEMMKQQMEAQEKMRAALIANGKNPDELTPAQIAAEQMKASFGYPTQAPEVSNVEGMSSETRVY